MYRNRLEDLKCWKAKKGHCPLILRGARQVGKTWLLQEFGRVCYKQTIYINFEYDTDLHNLFDINLDPARIIQRIEISRGVKIDPKHTLVIFDEIQEVPRGLTSLKYFCENAPQYDIVCAGSTLGVLLHSQTSFPVGKVDFLDLSPMTFDEFLRASNTALADAVEHPDWPLLTQLHTQLTEELKRYLFVGGMPDAVKTWYEDQDFGAVRQCQWRILHSYQSDFSKHATKEILPRIQMIWDTLPAQLAKENKKFIYGVIREGARAKDFELALMWLEQCGLLLKCHRVSTPGYPLKAYMEISHFKVFLVDVGLLGAMSGLQPVVLFQGNNAFTEFKGALTEQYVMQELHAHSKDFIGYWSNERSTAEVDFMLQGIQDYIPVEVKAGVSTKAKSFRLFYEKYSPQEAFRISILPYQDEGWMKNIPLYAAGCIAHEHSNSIS